MLCRTFINDLLSYFSTSVELKMFRNLEHDLLGFLAQILSVASFEIIHFEGFSLHIYIIN